MARLHAITGNQWRPTVRIAGKNILGFGKTVRGPRVPGQCGFRGGAAAGTIHFKSSELMIAAAEW